jgi:hypothetical protein
LGEVEVSVFVSLDVVALPFAFFAFFDFFIFFVFFAPDGVVVSDFVSVVFDVSVEEEPCEDEPCAKALVAASAKAANNVAIVRTIWPPWRFLARPVRPSRTLDARAVPDEPRKSSASRRDSVHEDRAAGIISPVFSPQRRACRAPSRLWRKSARDRPWARPFGQRRLRPGCCSRVLTFARVKLRELLFGRPLRSDEGDVERVGFFTAIPILGLDALSSAAYGPEALLTVLLPLGAAASSHALPLTFCIVAMLVVVAFSYGQTIRAYPNGGGSFTVAKENLGSLPGLVAAAALCTDYILNVAVAISAGTGALASAVPALLPHTLLLCLAVLLLLTIVNLRGVRDSGVIFLLPTYLFLGCLLATIAMGIVKTVLAGGHPAPEAPFPVVSASVAAATPWILLRAFGSGCTALTGIEAVSNAVPIFRKPKIVLARRTLGAIVMFLIVLLIGVALLSRAYGVQATPPGEPGY